MHTLVMTRVGIEITELKSGNRLLSGSRGDQRLFEHFLAPVADLVAVGEGGFRRVGLPLIEMIEHRGIDAIEVSGTTDMQAQSKRIPYRYTGRRNVARYSKGADRSAEVLGLPLSG